MFLAQLDTSKGMLATHDWMKELTNLKVEEEVIEVRFKNNRKEFYRNGRLLRLQKDDRIVVDVEGGHDVGTVSLTGALAKKRFDSNASEKQRASINQVYRIANETDIEKWLEAWESFPAELINLETDRGIMKPLNADVLKGVVQYALDNNKTDIRYTISIDHVKQYISLNKKGKVVKTGSLQAN